MFELSEREMYEPVRSWLHGYLEGRYGPVWKVRTAITGHEELSSVLVKMGLDRLIPESPCYQVKVDIVGILRRDPYVQLSLVECKDKEINVMAVSQALGYSMIVRPLHSFLISPFVPSPPVISLFRNYRRFDILNYYKNRKLIIAKWDSARNEIEYNSIIPAGVLSEGDPEMMKQSKRRRV